MFLCGFVYIGIFCFACSLAYWFRFGVMLPLSRFKYTTAYVKSVSYVGYLTVCTVK